MTRTELKAINDKLIPQGKRMCSICFRIYPISFFNKNSRCRQCRKYVAQESAERVQQRKIEEYYQNNPDQE